MHWFERYREDKGVCELFGKEVHVVGDPDWVEQAINEAWFSIAKNRGTWWVYLPYILVFDVPGRDCTIASTARFFDSANRVFESMNIRYRLIENDNGHMNYYQARFGTPQRADEFACMMQLYGCRYIPQSQVRRGP